ncbi:hypothetical protein ACFYZB_17980 [Streptomyces sp. NPDC001852]|uniref:hypothetical protein n=1 Tax=Streptomyces sp. NPDC001852 TaxID=3364619 RepID=UPI00368786B0
MTQAVGWAACRMCALIAPAEKTDEGVRLIHVGRSQLLLDLLGIVPAGTLTLPAQKWLWARQRERTAGAGSL